MKNSKGVTIVFITIIILVIILIAFLVYEIVFVDIFDIMNKNEVAKNNKPILNISTNVNEINEDEINITQNVQQNEEYANLENLYENIITTQENVDYYYYDQLDEYAKIIYKGFENNKENMKSGTYTIDFGNQFNELLNSDGGEEKLNIAFQSAWNAYTYDNMDLFYIDVEKLILTINTTTALSIHNVKISNGENNSYLKQEFQTNINLNEKLELLNKIKGQIKSQLQGYNDYVKVKEVHNWLIKAIEYDTNENTIEPYSIYGALTQGKAVCEGYARSFKYIMDELEIPCVLVSGTATNSNGITEAHAWNYVLLNGDWYAIDVTWDDPIIIGEGTVSEDTNYKYFLKGANTFLVTHKPDGYLSQNSIEFKFPTLNNNDYEILEVTN